MNCPKAIQYRESLRLVESLFSRLFYDAYRTRLCGGAEEPLYRPVSDCGEDAVIYYREDFISSALHEVAHWCIAGSARRKQLDFGYWYQPDGRSSPQQREFEAVEVKPQALESLFSLAAQVPFSISSDNLSGETRDSNDFCRAVAEQRQGYCRDGLPSRAAAFYTALAEAFYGPSLSSLQHAEAC